MFDLGWAELLIVAVVALIIVGPKDLPAALRTVTGLVRQARSMAREFQRGIEEIASDSGIQEIKRELQSSVDLGLDSDLREALDPDFDDKPKLSSPAKSDPATGGNSILSPEVAKMASKPPPPPAATAAKPNAATAAEPKVATAAKPNAAPAAKPKAATAAKPNAAPAAKPKAATAAKPKAATAAKPKAATAAKPNTAPAKEAGPPDTPKPDITDAGDAAEGADVTADAPETGSRA